MSSKRVPEHAGQDGSIAIRLTFWYALLSALLVAAAGSILYLVLADCLRRDDDQWLAGQIAEIGGILRRHPNEAQTLRRERVMLPGSYVRVLDAQGNKLIEAPNQADAPAGRPAAAFDFLAGPAGAGQDWVSGEGAMYRLMHAHIDAGPGFTVEVAIDRSAEELALRSYQHIMWGVLACSLVLSVVGGHVIARRSLQPVSRLAAIIDELGVAHQYRRIADDGWPRELRPLAANFDQLLERLDTSFSRISRFSADIAHELRTPLHILRGEAELALSKLRSDDEYRDCIISATEEYARLMRLVDALLFLARSDSPESVLDRQSLVLEEEIRSVCAFYQALADEQDTALDMNGSGTIAADPGLLRRAVGNLLTNALRHTPADGHISISIVQTAGRGVEIAVRDTGEGIAAKDMPFVFDRLYRADNSRSGRGAGAGLGLAIVQSIMHLHGGSVTLSSEPGEGTVARLFFPAPAEPA